MTVLHDPDTNQIARPSGIQSRSRRISAGIEGTGVALALGGGFARGFAHLGVLEVLEQERIPISAIAGTSIGGLLGAAYADGISIQELCDLGRKVCVRDFIRFHRSGQTSRHNDLIGEFVREWFHSKRVEDLGIPTSIVTTDIDTCAAHVFTSGPLEVAIRATCAFPGLFQPVEHEGRLLADGCIVAPVPTAIAARMKSLCVLGVAVGSTVSNASFPQHLPGRRSPGGKTLHRDQAFLGTLESKGLPDPSWSRNADMLLEPAVHQIKWDDFKSVDQAHDAGADVMRRALPYVREMLQRRFQSRGSEEDTVRLQRELVS